MAPHRLLYLCDWLPPNFGAVGQYSLLFARQHAAEGMDVVLAGLGSAATRWDEETHHPDTGEPYAGRLRILRLHAPNVDRARLIRRTWWTVRTNLRLLWATRRHARAADEVRFTGSPPFLVHLVVPLNILRRKRLTYRITDFHPECLMAALPRVGWPLKLFYRFTLFLRRRVHGFEVLGEDQRRRLEEIGIPAERITIKRDPSPVAIPPGTEPLERPAELADKIVLLYSGNFGVAHDDDTFIAGYVKHHREGTGRVGLWLNAVGAKADRVESRLRAEGVPVVRSSLVPLEELPRLLVTPDAHLITLREAFVGFVLPSKVYGCIESGRGVLYVGPRTSDVHLLCERGLSTERYRQIELGDAEGVCAALEALVAQLGPVHEQARL